MQDHNVDSINKLHFWFFLVSIIDALYLFFFVALINNVLPSFKRLCENGLSSTATTNSMGSGFVDSFYIPKYKVLCQLHDNSLIIIIIGVLIGLALLGLDLWIYFDLKKIPKGQKMISVPQIILFVISLVYGLGYLYLWKLIFLYSVEMGHLAKPNYLPYSIPLFGLIGSFIAVIFFIFAIKKRVVTSTVLFVLTLLLINSPIYSVRGAILLEESITQLVVKVLHLPSISQTKKDKLFDYTLTANDEPESIAVKKDSEITIKWSAPEATYCAYPTSKLEAKNMPEYNVNHIKIPLVGGGYWEDLTKLPSVGEKKIIAKFGQAISQATTIVPLVCFKDEELAITRAILLWEETADSPSRINPFSFTVKVNNESDTAIVKEGTTVKVSWKANGADYCIPVSDDVEPKLSLIKGGYWENQTRLENKGESEIRVSYISEDGTKNIASKHLMLSCHDQTGNSVLKGVTIRE